MSISELIERLRDVPPGRLDSEIYDEVIGLLSGCWDAIAGSSDTSMASRKVCSSRVENLTWEPPHLSFVIERHGGRVQGSKSAEMQSWSVDVENNKAICGSAGYRRLEPFLPRLDTKALARQVHDLIQRGAVDDRLTWKEAACVKVNVSVIIPDGPAKQTTQGRRKRFRGDLEPLMQGAGWIRKPAGTQFVFQKISTL